MTLQQAIEIIGGLSKPSKMPCWSFSIPAAMCIIGMKLRGVLGSICSKCYALKGRYVFKVVQAALMRRFNGLTHPQWVEAMTFVIEKQEKSGFFRWHDSGDLQGQWHLENIAKVARNLPGVQFWLPTREYSTVAKWLETNQCPPNLTIRLSALMLEGQPPLAIANRLGLVTSGVTKSGFTCPAPNQKGKCLDCRACWSKEIANVQYKQH